MGGRGGREAEEGGVYVSLQLINIAGQQKPTQDCKAIILQLKINFKRFLKRERELKTK